MERAFKQGPTSRWRVAGRAFCIRRCHSAAAVTKVNHGLKLYRRLYKSFSLEVCKRECEILCKSPLKTLIN